MRRIVLAAPVIALLAACATGPCPSLAPQLEYCLQPPAAVPPVVSLQLVEVRQGGQSETMLVQIEGDGRRLAVVGMSPIGQTVVSATWDGDTVTVQATPPSLGPGPAAMLAVAQFGLVPPELLRPGFASDLRMRVDDAPDGATIDVRDASGRTLLVIRRTGPAAPFARVEIALPTADIELSSRALTEQPAPAAR